MLFFKHRMNELYVHQLHTQHKILHQSGFYIIINKIVSVFGASSRLVLGDGEGEEGEATKRDKYGSPCTKSTVNKVFDRFIQCYKVICFHRIDFVVICLNPPQFLT